MSSCPRHATRTLTRRTTHPNLLFDLFVIGAQATGREARVEARVARREEARAREGSPELTRLPGGGDIMGGGGDDSFQAALARQRRAQALQV